MQTDQNYFKSVSLGQSKMRQRGIVQVVAGWLALALYLGYCAPLGLCAAVVAGSLDSAHQVYVSQGQHGVELVLHHETSQVPHQHGLIAQTLTLFARPATSASPDHVLAFGTSENFSRTSPLCAQKRMLEEQPAIVLPDADARASSRKFIQAEAPRKSDRQGAQRLSPRSPILRI